MIGRVKVDSAKPIMEKLILMVYNLLKLIIKI